MQAISSFQTVQSIRRQSNLEVIWALCAVVVLLAFTYPIVSLAASAFLLINLPDYTSPASRRTLGVILFVSAAIMISQRPYGGESDDMASYYGVYRSLRDGDVDSFFVFGGGIEIGLPVIFYLSAKLLPELTPNGLMLVCALTSSMIFFCWVESTFFAEGGRERGPMLMGVALLMLNIFYSTQIVRQFISLTILLFALSPGSWRRRILFLVIASCFHLSAIVFLFAYWIGRRGILGLLAIIGTALAVRFYFAQLLAILDILPPIIADKLAYYVDNNAEYTTADMGSLKLLVQLCLISIASFLWSGPRLPASVRRWHVVPWVSSIVHACLLSIPLASLRTTLMVHSVATGVIAHRLIHPRHRMLLLAVFNTILLYKLYGYATTDDSPIGISAVEALSGAFQAGG